MAILTPVDALATWSITGASDVNEGASATYTIHLDGTMQAGETATIQLALGDINTVIDDYTNFIDAVSTVVLNDSHLQFDSVTGMLTFTSSGAPMNDLIVTLGAVNDLIKEGPEQYQIGLSNPGSTTGSNVNLGLNNVITTIHDTTITESFGGRGIEYTEIPLNITLASADNSEDIVSMHISGLPTGMSASLNFGTMNIDGSYTLTGPDLVHLQDLKLITERPEAPPELNGTLHVDVSSNEGSSIVHSILDIHFSILEHV